MRRLARRLFTLCSAVSLVLFVASVLLFSLYLAGARPRVMFRSNDGWWWLGVVGYDVWLEQRDHPRDPYPRREPRTLRLPVVACATAPLPAWWWWRHLGRRGSGDGLGGRSASPD